MIGAQGLPRIGRSAGTLIMLAATGAVAIAVLPVSYTHLTLPTKRIV